MTTYPSNHVVTADEFSALSNSVDLLLSPPVFEGRQTVSQNIATSTSAAITLDAEDIDSYNGHDAVTNTSRYTIQRAGRYQISGAIAYAPNATGGRHAEIFVNGTIINGGSANAQAITAAGTTTRVASRTITKLLAVNDYVELYAFQTSGSLLATAVSSFEHSTLSVRWVGTV